MARSSGIGTSPKVLCFLQLKPTYPVRNWVAKYASSSGAGKHRVKKGKVKHKLKEIEDGTNEGCCKHNHGSYTGRS